MARPPQCPAEPFACQGLVIPPIPPAQPLVPVPPFWLLSCHPWGPSRASRTWVLASPGSVCLSVCLIVHWLFQMAHSPVLALLQDHDSAGCQWLMLPSAHKGVHSYAEFWTGEGWGAKQQPSSSSAAAGFARGALLPSPYLLLQMTSCSQSSAAKPVQKLGLPLGTSVFLMEILHLNARSPWVSPRGNWEPGMTLSMPCSHCVWSLSWPEEWSR